MLIKIFFFIFLLNFETLAAKSELKQLLDEALQNSQDFLLLQNRIDQKKEKKKQAQALFLPTLELINTLKVQETQSSGLASPFIGDAYQPSSKLSISQPIFQGFSEYASLRQTQLELEIAEFQFISQRNIFWDQLLQSFIRYQSQLKEIDNLRQLRENLKNRILELEKRVKIGRARVVDLYSAKAQYYDVQSEIHNTNLILEKSLLELSLYLPKERWQEITISLNSTFNESEYRQRIDEIVELRLLQKNIEERDIQIQINRVGYYPNLSLEGNYYFARTGIMKDSKWDVSLNLEIPLYSGGATSSQVREAYLQKNESIINYEKNKKEFYNKIDQYIISFKNNLEQLREKTEALKMAEKAYKTQSKEYRIGLVSYLEVIQTEKDFWNLKRNLDRLEFSMILNKMQLHLLFGEIL